jgi:sugar diacid utilization regulator
MAWVRRLSAPSRLVEQPASSEAVRGQATTTIGADAVAWAVCVGKSVSDGIVEAVPSVAETPSAYEILRQGAETRILAILRELVEPDNRLAPTVEGIAIAQQFAHRNIPLADVLRALHLGHKFIATHLTREVVRLVESQHHVDTLGAVSRQLFDFHDAHGAGVADAYLQERDQWMASTTARRREVIDAVLAGELDDAEGKSQVLGHDLHRHHLALICIQQPAASSSHARDLREAMTLLHRALGRSPSLNMPADSLTQWGWLSSSRPFRVDDVKVAVGGAHLADSVQLFVGQPASGIQGFRRSHLTARAVQDYVVGSRGPRARSVFYSDIAVASLLTAEPERAFWFAEDVLGELAGPGPRLRDLRRTLRSYLDSGGSLKATAADINVAKSTVAYRIKQVGEIAGLPGEADTFEVLAALTIYAAIEDSQRRER